MSSNFIKITADKIAELEKRIFKLEKSVKSYDYKTLVDTAKQNGTNHFSYEFNFESYKSQNVNLSIKTAFLNNVNATITVYCDLDEAISESVIGNTFSGSYSVAVVSGIRTLYFDVVTSGVTDTELNISLSGEIDYENKKRSIEAVNYDDCSIVMYRDGDDVFLYDYHTATVLTQKRAYSTPYGGHLIKYGDNFIYCYVNEGKRLYLQTYSKSFSLVKSKSISLNITEFAISMLNGEVIIYYVKGARIYKRIYDGNNISDEIKMPIYARTVDAFSVDNKETVFINDVNGCERVVRINGDNKKNYRINGGNNVHVIEEDGELYVYYGKGGYVYRRQIVGDVLIEEEKCSNCDEMLTLYDNALIKRNRNKISIN